MTRNASLVGCLALMLLFLIPLGAGAEGSDGLSRGQAVYVPAYSDIYHGSSERPFLLAVTLSILNIDPERAITITAVDYYETAGQHLKQYLDAPVSLKPLGSLRYVVQERDDSGGSGANFIVKWESEQPVNPPIIESVMIGTQTQQGISFTSRGRVIIPSK